MLVLEDDAFFEDGTLSRCNASLEHVLSASVPFDLFLLGWSGFAKDVAAEPVVGQRCVYWLRHWASSHAYVISRAAMERWRHLQLTSGTGRLSHIDNYLAAQSHTRVLTSRPMCAFQRHHADSATASSRRFQLVQSIKADPGLMHRAVEAPIFQRARLDEPTCRPLRRGKHEPPAQRRSRREKSPAPPRAFGATRTIERRGSNLFLVTQRSAVLGRR